MKALNSGIGLALLVLTIMVAALLAWVMPAKASQACGPRDGVTALLSERYGEVVQGSGLAANGMVLELFVSSEHGTWTIAYTDTRGVTCLMASGTVWEDGPSSVVPPGVEG